MRPRYLSALGLAVPALALLGAGSTAALTPNGDYEATLGPVNKAGASGSVELMRHGSRLEAHVRASGLDAGVHLAHIHGFRKGMAECPGQSADADGNGVVDLIEGLPSYGPVLKTLSQPGDTGTSLDYARTYTTLDNGDSIASLGALSKYVVVVHGVDLDGDGVADNPDAEGDGAGHDDNEISMPALCGAVEFSD